MRKWNRSDSKWLLRYLLSDSGQPERTQYQYHTHNDAVLVINRIKHVAFIRIKSQTAGKKKQQKNHLIVIKITVTYKLMKENIYKNRQILYSTFTILHKIPGSQTGIRASLTVA